MTTTSDRRLRVHDLVHRPGASRTVALSVDVPPDLDPDLVSFDGPVRFAGVLESVVEGVLVRGTLSARMELSCSRCLRPVDVDADVEVAELFSPPGAPGADEAETPEEGYELIEGELDLDVLLRDALVPAVPYQPLCDAACRGLCPTCGVDRNEVACECEDVRVDGRWAALEGLDLPEG